ncbi:MAG: hypothetical protein BroJett018_53260 [Chloroflexota bacterium]|nr:MAG: hypothetical protein BroJett018_53260 [Chloroflexota bacterium]
MRRIVTLFLLIYAFGVLAITGVHIVARRQPAESGWIAYHAESGDVIVVRRDGRVQTQLNPKELTVIEFEWANDGQSIFVTAIERTWRNVQPATLQIWVKQRVAEQITFFEEGLNVNFLQVSPDGDWLYYVLHYDNGNGNSARTRLATLAVEPLTMLDRIQDQKAVLRSWISPNGQRLVMTVFDSASSKTGLYLVDIASKTFVNLLEDIDSNMPTISWSPDSQQLAVSSQGGFESIRVFPVDDPTQETRLSSRFAHPGSAIWSPDGEWIAYIGSRQDNMMLYLVHPEGSDEKILYQTDETFGTEPQWSANGRWLAMGVSRATNNPSETLDLMIFEADGSAPPKIIADDVIPYGQVAWSPPLDKAWSPNAFLIGGVACILMACVGQYIANHPRR